MEYYDESGNHITDPDLSKGKVTYQDKVRGTHKQLLPGTEQMGIDGKGLYQEITDHETIGIYHAYTNEEIAQQKADAEAKAAEEKQAAAINALPTQMTQMQSALCYVYEQLLSK